MEIIYYKRETSEFAKMREAKLLWKPENIFKDYRKYILTGYLLKMVQRYIGENIRFPEIFRFTLKMLKEINQNEVNINTLYSIILKFLKIQGVGPEMEKCIKCEKIKDYGFFVIKEGGIFCEECSNNFENKIFIDKKTLSSLKFLKRENLGKVKNLKIENRDKIEKIIISFVNFYLGENFTEDIKKIQKI